MPSELRTPRTLASWLELDYFQRRRLFSTWWWWILGGTALGAVLLGGMYASSGKRAFQAGPVSHPHALFNDDCGKCHEKAFTTVTRLWAGDEVGTVTDRACSQCHAGPPHHGAAGRCVDCHKEHRGHGMLMRYGEGTCVKCHVDLDATGGPRTGVARSVTAFTSGGHPEPRTPPAHSRRFPHDVHLTDAGVPVRGADGKMSFKKLACIECHEPDAAGKLMKPISYNRHCAECHPLGKQLVGNWQGEEMLAQARAFARERIPHPGPGQGVGVVRGSLRDALSRFISDPRHAAFLQPAGQAPRPLPDRGPGASLALNKEQFEWVNEQMAKIEPLTFGKGGCGYCHQMGQDKGGLPTVVRPKIPDRWWTRSVFRHEAHTMMSCLDCHDAKHSTRDSEVMMPKMEVCLKCHDTNKRASARSGCVQCHIYHDPDGRREPPPAAR
jgi:predicted CXXCH cytochrome family protein